MTRTDDVKVTTYQHTLRGAAGAGAKTMVDVLKRE